MKKTVSYKLAFCAILVALAMIMSYIEMLVPFFGNKIGLKLGLANIVVLLALYVLDFKYAFVISIIRVSLISVLFGTAYSFAFSMAGAVISLLVMVVLKKVNIFSIVGISMAGAVGHNIGQITVACFVLGNGMIYYMPVLMVSGLITGIIIGILSGIVIKRIKKSIETYVRM